MANVLGIICEYNPFHNGHLLHLNESKKACNADFTIAVMSGNFTQRGDVALFDKWTRAKMALANGVDLVIELPTVYATSSAENFADGAIKILNTLGIVDYISFGSESGDINLLNTISSILYKEPKELSNLINMQLKSGLSYPKARELAISTYFRGSKKYSEALQSPNNVLAIEYLKSLKKHKSNIVPITLKRDYSDYNSTSTKNGIASATAIRQLLKENKKIHRLVPFETYEIIENKLLKKDFLEDLSVFEKEIIFNLRRMSLEEISKIQDVTEGLENKIKYSANNFNNLNDLINNIKSKRFTRTRIQRILVYSLLGITKKDINLSKRVIPYIRVLGFNKHGKKIISSIAANNPKAKIIISLKRFLDTNPDNSTRQLLSKDILATNIYTLASKENPVANLDYTHKVTEIV
ncbi:MAG: nucleotidyltransferase [Candidatus Scatovivens sp.]